MSIIRHHVAKILGKSSDGHQAHSVAEGVEGAAVGALLGTVSAKRATGLDMGKIPLDGAIGVGVPIAAQFMRVPKLLANAAGTALGVFTFRKTEAYWHAHPSTPKAHGEIGGTSSYGVDPIVEAAAKL